MDSNLIDICYKKHKKQISTSWDELARLYYSHSTGEGLRSKFKKYRKVNDVKDKSITKEKTEIDDGVIDATHLYKSTTEFKSNGEQISDKLLSMSENESKDPDFILKSHGYDCKTFELISAKNSIWNMNTKEDGIKTLYASKIAVKPKIELFDANWIKSTLEDLDLDSPVVEQKPYNIKGKTLEINLADVHIDKLCCVDETRNQYSTEMGIQRLWQVINDIVEKAKHYNIKKIILPFGQDVANIDNISYVLPKW